MNEQDKNISNEVLDGQGKLFARSVRRQIRLRKIKELLGMTLGQRCLEISAGDGVISHRLRQEGGEWTTLVPHERAKTSLSFFVKDHVAILPSELIDAPDESFDVVVIVDSLERMSDDHLFVRECNRVLKVDGRLVISVARKPMVCLGCCSLRSLLGLSWKKKQWARSGYTPHEFFNVLKDGFDVPQTISYSTCLLEFPGLLCEAAANRMSQGAYNMPSAKADSETVYQYTKLTALSALVYPLMWILSKLDEVLLMVIPGNHLVAKTKRRVWRKRRVPVLVDGRSITEAALNTKIGTAAPF